MYDLKQDALGGDEADGGGRDVDDVEGACELDKVHGGRVAVDAREHGLVEQGAGRGDIGQRVAPCAEDARELAVRVRDAEAAGGQKRRGHDVGEERIVEGQGALQPELRRAAAGVAEGRGQRALALRRSDPRLDLEAGPAEGVDEAVARVGAAGAYEGRPERIVEEVGRRSVVLQVDAAILGHKGAEELNVRDALHVDAVAPEARAKRGGASLARDEVRLHVAHVKRRELRAALPHAVDRAGDGGEERDGGALDLVPRKGGDRDGVHLDAGASLGGSHHHAGRDEGARLAIVVALQVGAHQRAQGRRRRR